MVGPVGAKTLPTLVYMRVLDTGRYTISNVNFGRFAVLPDANKGTGVISAASQEDKPAGDAEKASLCPHISQDHM
jgi:hypothetical protein